MKSKRPIFNLAWAASQKIYSPTDPAEHVAKVIGGAVAVNIRNPDQHRRWKNTCAVRMSYILAHAGLIIPSIPKQTVSGGDLRQYFFRVPDLISFLRKQWGKPDFVLSYPPSPQHLHSQKGVILFEIDGWRDARGHASLFNGMTCYDHCYFDEPGKLVRTPKANFWSLT